ncbi:Nn.00g032800.m01.CDS01 [Neocucurbitaria sp. VM-36]
MAPSRNRSNLIFVRRRKSGDIDIRRANEFTKRPSASSLPQKQAIHYVGSDRSRLCRCNNPSRHYDHLIYVASESTHLDYSLKLYMDRHCLQSCTIADFRTWQQQTKAAWARDGVDSNDFHYASKRKDVVCRCSKSNTHSYGAPRNPEIIEQCAEFFRAYKDETFCTKDQWQAFDSDSLSEGSPESRGGSFKYDSESMCGFLRSRALEVGCEPVLPQMKIRSTAERVVPVDMKHLRSGPHGETDIPEKVWASARPSLWNPRCGSETSTSTPLGSAFTPIDKRTHAAHGTVAPPLACPRASQHESTTTCWSDIQQDAGISDDEKSPKKPRVDSPSLSQSSELHSTMSVDLFYDEAVPQGTPIAELPAQRINTELDARPVHRHTATLWELEGLNQDTISKLAGKQSPIRETKTPSHMSTITKIPVRLSSHIIQGHDVVQRPDQEEFFLRHVVFSSRTNPAPTGSCTVCSEPYQNRYKRVLILPGCGHAFHEQCLFTEFRARDCRIGSCPICYNALCKRTLADRIDTDREAIFGAQFTRLHNSVNIDFPQRGEVVTCGSEEEVAVAQLRLLKDYVDVYAEEIFRLWEANRAEPDWYGGVVRPVVKLFHSWNVPGRQNRYFADRKAFLKLVAWAELVRLTNTTRAVAVKTQGEDAVYPQLAELHRKFMWARDRYDKEKKTWKTKSSNVLHCEEVAQDAIKLAIGTYLL